MPTPPRVTRMSPAAKGLTLLVIVVVLAAAWWVTRGTSTGKSATAGASTGTSHSAPARAGASAGSSAAKPVRTPGAARATPDSGLSAIAESALPAQARHTLSLIRAGGPYPYSQDDGVFGNLEGLLPKHQRGYYREYTVVTPGSGDRGPRRIIAGADGDRYYTADHYASFQQIEEGR
ncbi:MAG TPA: ribonuclease domain-containing protein [Phycicoccus sp.]|nr:ribonuclease domain-containing protein [Phycicoccus sp.]